MRGAALAWGLVTVDNAPMTGHGLPRHPLGFLPTPLTALPRLTAALDGPRLYVKRDDQTGLALGGNKTRKLEYLIADALAQGCDSVITAGAAQSNHCRQTAAAAAACGLACHLVLGGTEPGQRSGNLLLDGLFGAEIHWAGENRKGEDIPRISEDLRAVGRRPYLVPYGGSNAIGAAAFVDALGEVAGQARATGVAFSHVVFASSSGGTHAGLMVGARVHALDVTLVGIAIDKPERGEEPLDAQIVAIANDLGGRCGLSDQFGLGEVHLDGRFTGDGYGVVGDLEREAIGLMARREGILVDPVYTGRALGGLIALIRDGAFDADDRVLFWHTGGSPALFAYGAALSDIADAPLSA